VNRHGVRIGGPVLRPGGQVLIVTLLAITLLMGLIFFVYNFGDHVNRRLALQNAADAAAISGAGWTARSMNVIAMNNVAVTRCLPWCPFLTLCRSRRRWHLRR